MAEQREFLNAKKPYYCDCGRPADLFIQKVVSAHSERYYGYAQHSAWFEHEQDGKRVKLAPRHRCYIGLLSKYVTGFKCHTCGKRSKHVQCYACRHKRRPTLAA